MEANKRIVQCPNEKCRNDAAYWYQLQIRSADEPMTAFYKVGLVLGSTVLSLTDDSVPNVRRNGENELVFSASHTWSSGAFECTAIYPIFFHCSFSTVFFLIARLKICDLSPFNFFVKLVGWEPVLGSFRTMGVTASHSG
jgi:hypothetical protein